MRFGVCDVRTLCDMRAEGLLEVAWSFYFWQSVSFKLVLKVPFLALARNPKHDPTFGGSGRGAPDVDGGVGAAAGSAIGRTALAAASTASRMSARTPLRLAAVSTRRAVAAAPVSFSEKSANSGITCVAVSV